MIIESGDDVLQVLCGNGDEPPRGLWVVTMDANLRLLAVDPVTRNVDGDIETYVDDIAQELSSSLRPVEYFAIAWSVDDELDSDGAWLPDLDARLSSHPEFGGFRFLGFVVFDRTTMFGSIPRCEFSLYPELGDLPRAVSIPGPHGMTCPCLACAADRREFGSEFGLPGDETYDTAADSYGRDGLYAGTTGYTDVSDPSLFDVPVASRSRRRRPRSRHVRIEDSQLPYLEPETPGAARYDPFAKRWWPQPARAFKRWSDDEQDAVLKAHVDGLSCFDISLIVQRQPTAIAKRLYKMGYSARTAVPGRPF
jgi:hypothetical protein